MRCVVTDVAWSVCMSVMTVSPAKMADMPFGLKKGKGKKRIYISLLWPRWYTQSAQAWNTQFYLQISPCLPFLRERSPDVATTATAAADIQLQLTTHLSTPKG